MDGKDVRQISVLFVVKSSLAKSANCSARFSGSLASKKGHAEVSLSPKASYKAVEERQLDRFRD